MFGVTFFKKAKDSRARRTAKVWAVRFRRTLYVSLFVALLGGAFFALVQQGAPERIAAWIANKTVSASAASGFVLKDILVEGRKNVEADALRAATGFEEGAPLFALDIDRAQKKLEQNSWIEKAHIKRRLPDKIVITLEERKPAALWQHQKKIFVIDQTGNVLLDRPEKEHHLLPLIVGKGADKAAEEFLTLLRAEAGLAPFLQSATRVGERRWDLSLANGVTVKLPEHDPELALRRLMDAEEKYKTFSKDVSIFDLRQEERLVLKLPLRALLPTPLNPEKI